MALLEGREGMVSLIECKVGPKLGEDGPASQLRSFYRDHYQTLDRFDRVWYQIEFLPGARDWVSYYSWSLLQTAVINARTIFCALRDRYMPIKDFLAELVSYYVETITP